MFTNGLTSLVCLECLHVYGACVGDFIRLTGLPRFFHAIANLIFGVFLRRAGISAKRASPPNRARSAHVIGP